MARVPARRHAALQDQRCSDWSHGAAVTAGKVLYWVAVLLVSLAILVAVILFFESRDSGSLARSGTATPPQLGR